LQERLHLPVQSHDLGEDLFRGYPRVHLREIGSRPGQLLNGVIACVRAGDPGQDVPGLVCGIRSPGSAAPGRYSSSYRSVLRPTRSQR
jgi:hypothetical protein